jgi:hypothetical protein
MRARQHVLSSIGVAVRPRLGMVHRANHGKLVSESSRPGQQVGKLHAADRSCNGTVWAAMVRDNLWLGVPRVEVRQSALFQNDQDVLGSTRSCRDTRLGSQELRQRKPQHARHPGMQEPAAVQQVVEHEVVPGSKREARQWRDNSGPGSSLRVGSVSIPHREAQVEKHGCLKT